MNDHHLVLGTLTDFLTGHEIPDTLDERYRQNIARLLVHEKGYQPSDIVQDHRLTAETAGKKAILKIDFIIAIKQRNLMVIKYGPGSIITRHRPALAASRLIGPYQIPCVVVTNGEDADILDGKTGMVQATGLDSIPSKAALLERSDRIPKEEICAKRSVMESRILYAFDVDGSCPCDTDICRIEP